MSTCHGRFEHACVCPQFLGMIGPSLWLSCLHFRIRLLHRQVKFLCAIEARPTVYNCDDAIVCVMWIGLFNIVCVCAFWVVCLNSPSLLKKDCVFECFFALLNAQCVGQSFVFQMTRSATLWFSWVLQQLQGLVLLKSFLLLYHSFVSFISFVVICHGSIYQGLPFFCGAQMAMSLLPAFDTICYLHYKQFCDDTKVGEMVIKEAEGTIAVLKADIEKAIVDVMVLTKKLMKIAKFDEASSSNLRCYCSTTLLQHLKRSM